MIKVGELNENKVLPVYVEGKITKEDYKKFLPEIEKILNKNESVRFLIDLEDFEGFELGAFWEEIKFDYKYRKKFGKTAIIGYKKWEELGTKFSNLFFNAEMKFFHLDEASKAFEWVNS